MLENGRRREGRQGARDKRQREDNQQNILLIQYEENGYLIY